MNMVLRGWARNKARKLRTLGKNILTIMGVAVILTYTKEILPSLADLQSHLTSLLGLIS